MRVFIGTTGLALLASGVVQAQGLPADMLASTNALQRAAWACEAGAAKLAQPASAGQRFFLGVADPSGAHNKQAPLALSGTVLTGLGNVSDATGFSDIGFSCTLSDDLRQASAFSFDVLGPTPASDTPPSAVAAAPNVADMVWTTAGDASLSLVHGVPETDDIDFSASCARGSDAVSMSLSHTVSGLSTDSYATIGVTSGGNSALYVAQGVMNDSLGAFMPTLDLPTGDPLIGWMETGNTLLINIGSEVVYEVSLKGSAKPARDFAAACAG